MKGVIIMKKLVSLVLCAIMLICPLSVAAGAQGAENPLIVVTGYGTPSVFVNQGKDNERRIWQFSVLDVLKYIAGNLPRVAGDIGDFLTGKYDGVGSTVAHAGSVILPEMYCNPDGTSKTVLEHYPNDPAVTSYEYLLANGRTKEIYEAWLCEPLAQEFMDADNIFIFQYDFRMSAVDITNELNQYVDDVLEYTGAKKVNIFGLSYGGFLTGTFLSRFGTDGRVDNVVLSVPALGGTKFAKNFLTGKTDFPVIDLITFANSVVGIELDAEQTIGFLDNSGFNITGAAFLNDLHDMPLYWCSMWDLLSIEDYNELKGMLDPVQSAAILEKADYIHNEIMPNYTKNFNACMDAGVKISIVCSTGYSSAFGGEDNADMLVECKYATGSACTKLGERFSDGYTGKRTVCSDPAHNHISPSMEVDASCAYLPENTWFVDGQGHGVYFTEEYSLSLIEKLLFAGKAVDVHSDPAYPQFEISSLSTHGVYAKFDSSSSGYISSEDKALVIKNISARYPIKLTAVTCEGMDVTFDISGAEILAPGEAVSLPYTGSIPEVSAAYVGITVDFLRIGSLTPVNYRTFDFTICNGSAPEYDGTETAFTQKDGLVQKVVAVLNKLFVFAHNTVATLAGNR